MVSQLQVLNKILSTKDFSIVTANNLNEDFFFNYKAEFNYIKDHVAAANAVPDTLTFMNVFPEFELQEVNEPNSYLLDVLYKDYNTAYLTKSFNAVKRVLEAGDTDKAMQLYMEGLSGIRTGGAISPISFKNDKSRLEHFEDKASGKKQSHYSTGLPELDEIIGGIETENENMTICARPGQGKTQLLCAFCAAAALAGLKCGFYEGEMTPDKLMYRIDTYISHIRNGALNRGDSSVLNDYQNYMSNVSDMDIGDIEIITQNQISGEPTVAALDAFITQEKLDILFVDQYSLLVDTHQARTDFEHVGNIAKDMKLLQVKHQIPIISVSQLNRGKNEDGSRDTSNVAGSDKISQYATTLLFLDQKETTDEYGNERVEFNIDVAKARDGGTGKKLTYAADFNRGFFQYIPQKKDGTTEEQANMLKDSYKVKSDGSDF